MKPEFNSDDITKPLVKRGLLEAPAEISECDAREGGSGFGVLLLYVLVVFFLCELGRVGKAYQGVIYSARGVVVLAQLWGGEEQNAADGDLEVFCECGPVCSCFWVGVGIVFFVGVSRFSFHFNV